MKLDTSSSSEIIEKLFKNEKRKLKIAILTPGFGFDGQGRVVETQAQELRNCGHRVTIFTLESEMSPPEGVELDIIGGPRNYYLEAIYHLFFPFHVFKMLKYTLKLKNFDLTISHHNSVGWLSLLAKWLWKIPYIFHAHSLNPPEAFPKIYQRVYIHINQLVYDFLVKRANYVFAVSQFVKEIIKNRTKRESLVVYNKVSDRLMLSGVNGDRVRKKHSLSPDDPIILFVGRITYNKRIELLIEAFKLVKQSVPNAKLIIVGRHYIGEYSARLKKMADDSIIFTGFVPDEELPFYYAACDVYATCSIHEGFNIPLVEAQKYGKPVIAFDIGPHREIVKNGLLIRKGDIKGFAKGIINILRGGSNEQEKHSFNNS